MQQIELQYEVYFDSVQYEKHITFVIQCILMTLHLPEYQYASEFWSMLASLVDLTSLE